MKKALVLSLVFASTLGFSGDKDLSVSKKTDMQFMHALRCYKKNGKVAKTIYIRLPHKSDREDIPKEKGIKVAFTSFPFVSSMEENFEGKNGKLCKIEPIATVLREDYPTEEKMMVVVDTSVHKGLDQKQIATLNEDLRMARFYSPDDFRAQIEDLRDYYNNMIKE